MGVTQHSGNACMGLTDLERQGRILGFLQDNKKATVTELAERLEVSEATIRRDLGKLEKQGHILKTYGGALIVQPTQFEFSYNERLSQHVKEKKAIGACAAGLIQPGNSVLLDSGTTVLRIAEALQDSVGLTVVTTGLPVILKLASNPNIQLYAVGGLFRAKSHDFVGPTLVSNLAMYTVDIAFLSVDGFHPEAGLSASDHSTADAVRAALRIAKRSIVVADSSKGGKRAFARIAAIDEVDMIISDSKLDPSVAEAVQRAGVELMLV